MVPPLICRLPLPVVLAVLSVPFTDLCQKPAPYVEQGSFKPGGAEIECKVRFRQGGMPACKAVRTNRLIPDQSLAAIAERGAIQEPLTTATLGSAR